MIRLLLVLVLLFVVGCSEGSAERQEPRATVSTPVEASTEAVARVTKAQACAQVDAALSRLETPLQLLADGGTPVSWTGDFAEGAKSFHTVGTSGPGLVGYYAAGLGDDLDRLVTALNSGRTSTVKAIGDVVTNRVRNLKVSCRHG